jgi:DNA modification methylase
MACSEPDDLVLDPFAGSGTSLAMAVKLGRRCLGIELNPEYAELARAAIMAVTDGHTAAEDGMIR